MEEKCLTAIKLLKDLPKKIEKLKSIPLKRVLFYDDDQIRNANELNVERGLQKGNVPSFGIYIFINKKGEIVYVGQGKRSGENGLRERIRQELRVVKGSNGATLSKNINTKDKKQHKTQEDFAKYIQDWGIKIIGVEEDLVSLAEYFLIYVFSTKEHYNIDY